MNQAAEDQRWMRRALELASSRRGYCAPNPAVGAVIIKDGLVLGEGAHQACGLPHAEVEALKVLGARAPGATLYVSLEPCCHQGRTPPCTEAILSAGIHRVIYGYEDPNSLVAGKGRQQLQDAGVEVLQCKMPEIEEFYRSYRYWRQHQRPWVRAKLAMSLDGKIAGPMGERISITGSAFKEHTYRCRQKSDAILTSAKTIQHDDPLLDVRIGNTIENKRLYIIDRRLELSEKARIWQNTQAITVFYSEQYSGKLPTKLIDQGIQVQPISEHQDQLDLEQIMAFVGRDGIHDCWVEAGGTLVASLLAAELLNEIQIACAPLWIGSSALSAFGDKLLNFNQFPIKRWVQIGDDVLCEMSQEEVNLCSVD